MVSRVDWPRAAKYGPAFTDTEGIRSTTMARGESPPDNEDLARWLSRIALGDRRAFEQLYRATCGYLMAVAWRVLQRRQLAEEVLQDAFVKVWHSAGAYDARLGVPMTWLINIVRNRAIDVRRARATATAEGPDDLEDGEDPVREGQPGLASGPEQWLEASIKKARVETCMGQLTAAQRQALALAYYQGMSHAEVAEALNAPLGTAKAWVRRGLTYLKNCLEAVGVHAS
jgi:RNA polymerase sigma-70 factor (ECF subfamily)